MSRLTLGTSEQLVRSGFASVIALLLVAITNASADLASDIRSTSASARLGTAVSYSVVEVATGRVIASEHESVLRKPASNMKVFTTGAALTALGGDFRFATQLVHDVRDGVSRLVIVGSGDPGFGDPELLARMSFTDSRGVVQNGMRANDLLTWWTESAVTAGITRIDEVVVDARIFDRECYSPEWPSDQRSRPYCAEVWGLNFHANMMFIGAMAGSTGKVTLDRFEPEYDWILGRNVATTGSAKSKSTFVVTRSATDNTLTVSGRLPTGKRADVDLSVHDTPSLFGELFARRLRAKGIPVGATRLATAADPLATGTVIGVIETPLTAVLQRANTDSSNLHAECLLKRLGAFSANTATALPGPAFVSGSWSNGSTALRAKLEERIGAAATGFVISDGSGLSHANRVTAAGMTAWLCSLAKDPALAEPFLQSLALAGESGTVAKRFAALAGSSVQVRCKTGYINGVSCLSGVAIGASGRKIAFSVLANGIEKIGTDAPKKLQEAIVMNIVHELEKDSSAQLNRVPTPPTQRSTQR